MQHVSPLDAPNFSSALQHFHDHGSGPCLAFDLNRISRLAAGLQRLGDAVGVQFLAAAKALPFDGLLDATATLRGLDISNGGEAERLVIWGGHGGRIGHLSLTGPAIEGQPYPKGRIADRLTVNVEHPGQLSALVAAGRLADRVGLGVRVATELGCNATRFGIQGDDLPQMTDVVLHQDFDTLHCHVEGDSPAGADHRRSLEYLLKLADSLRGRVRRLNLGGGFRGETLEEMVRLCRDLRATAPPQIELFLEPGSWLTASGGYAIGKILSRKIRRDLDATVVTLDLSRECHLRWSTPRLVDWRGAPPATRKVLFFGPTCYEADFLGAFEWPEALAARTEAEEAGTILFDGVSGYSAAFNTGFNGIPPARIFYYGNG